MEEFKLNKPIELGNGQTIDKLCFDWDALSMGDLKTANKISKMISDSTAGNVDNSTVSPRLDSNLRIAIAWVAAVKGTPGLMVNDVLKLSMLDALCLSEEAMTAYLFR